MSKLPPSQSKASSAGIGVFEVGLALRGKQELALTQYQIALMFTECSLVMFVVQGMVFAPWVKPWLIAWGLLHSRWKGRQMDARRMFAATLVLIGLGIVATFSPVWALL